MKLASKRDCTGCMACMDACSGNALDFTRDKNGYITLAFDPSKCIHCNSCSRVCPVLNCPTSAHMVSLAYAAWNNNAAQRKHSSSGGVFMALATTILRQGGVVYGAAIDQFDIKHIRVDRVEELPRLQGSKYQHSIMKGIYRAVKKDLQSGRRVLFSGLSCQVNGLYTFLRNTQTDNLLTVDTICGGISTMLPMRQYIQSGHYSGIKSFRDKERGWKSRGYKYTLKMYRTDGTEENLGNDNLVLRSFSSALLKRSSCLDCKFAGLHRISDCTIGDFWGDQRFQDQHGNGLSVILTHRRDIEAFLKESDVSFSPVTLREAVRENQSVFPARHALIRFLPSRHLALYCLRHGIKRLSWPLTGYESLWVLDMRLYLKMSHIRKKNITNEEKR